MIKSICVFCGSSDGKGKEYIDHAVELADLFVQKDIQLVYGGGGIGTMGALAKQIEKRKGKIIGVIPKALVPISGEMYGETILVKSMHQRKEIMHQKADALIALAGGFGTFEELLETITWSQLRITSKPIGILNTKNFYGHFISWIDHAVSEGFIDPLSQNIIIVKDNPKDLVEALEKYIHPYDNDSNFLKDLNWKDSQPHLGIDES